MVWYRGCWRRVERFFAARGVEEFSLDVAMAWVDQACGSFEKEQAGTLKQAGLCAAFDHRPMPHQDRQVNAAHNPALPIRFLMFS